jgi:hypothetical protein
LGLIVNVTADDEILDRSEMQVEKPLDTRQAAEILGLSPARVIAFSRENPDQLPRVWISPGTIRIRSRTRQRRHFARIRAARVRQGLPSQLWDPEQREAVISTLIHSTRSSHNLAYALGAADTASR